MAMKISTEPAVIAATKGSNFIVAVLQVGHHGAHDDAHRERGREPEQKSHAGLHGFAAPSDIKIEIFTSMAPLCRW